MTATQLYFLLKLDDFRSIIENLGLTALVLGGLAFILSLVGKGVSSVNESDEIAAGLKKIIKPSAIVVVVGIIFMLFRAALPSTKQLAILYVVPPIVNNENIQKIPGKVLNLANEWLEELKPNKGEKTDAKK
jgi:hypothetical protein